MIFFLKRIKGLIFFTASGLIIPRTGSDLGVVVGLGFADLGVVVGLGFWISARWWVLGLSWVCRGSWVLGFYYFIQTLMEKK
jgi:hypothetical protein